MPSFVFLGGNPTIIGCKLGKITNQRFNHVLRTVNIMNVTPSNEDFLPIFAHAVPILSIPDSAVGHFKIIPEKLILRYPTTSWSVLLKNMTFFNMILNLK
jgi:hypothetical protein